MHNNIYKDIISNIKDMYMLGKTITDKNNNIIDFLILDTNKSFNNNFKIDTNTDINKIIGRDIFKDNINILISGIKKASEEKEYIEIYYLESLKSWYEFKIYSTNTDEFYILINKENNIDKYTKKLLDVFPGGIWYKDIKGRYITSSKSMLSHPRVKDCEIIGKTDLEIQKEPIIAKNIMNNDQQLITDTKYENFQTTFKDGITYNTHKYCVQDEDGDILGTLGFYLDVTKQEQFKQLFEEHKKISQHIIESIPDQIVFKNIEGMYVYCNKSFSDYLGLNSPDEVIGKTDREVYKKDLNMLKLSKQKDEEVLSSKKSVRYEVKRLINGIVKYYDVIKTPFLDDNTTIKGIISVVRDITETKNTQIKLSESEEQKRIILDGTNDAVVLSNRDKILYVNSSFEDIFEINKDDLIKNPAVIYQLIHEEYKHKFDGYNYDTLYNMEFKIRTKDGKLKWIWYKDTNIHTSDGNERKITIIRDVTSQKESNLQLEQLRIDFFANITHEIRTPLNVMLSVIQLIYSKIEYNKELGEFLRHINILNQNSLRLLKLTNNLIDITKIDSGYSECYYSEYDIVYFIEEIFGSINEYAKTKNIELIFDTDIEEKYMYFDMDKIERIVLNLLSNAIKFNKQNGKIYFNINSTQTGIKFIIRDTGIGIPNNKIDSVFTRFSQVNNRMTKVSEGSGIGLYLSKSLIELHQGSISVNSELGKGTEFIVEIPDMRNNTIDKKDEFATNNYNPSVRTLSIEFSDIY